MGRTAKVERTTSETQITVIVNLDGTANSQIDTPIPFLTHMLEQIARHSGVELTVMARGDVHIDGHHTTEDIGITLGKTIAMALGDKRGIRRYGEATLPMDEALCQAALDFSGRTYFVDRLRLPKATVGTFDVELTPVFFEGFARGAQCNLHVRKIEGDNLHHIIECTFKAFARAMRQAIQIEGTAIASTKGTLEG